MSGLAPAADDTIRVYWMTGCTSCLRTKEFLTRHGVPFLSRNVLEEPEAYEELAAFGLRQVPIVTRGAAWVNGQALDDVARIAGIDWGRKGPLPAAELQLRLQRILAAAQRYTAQLPAAQLAVELPDRPRSYADLAYHIHNIADAFLEHDAGTPLEFDSYNRIPAKGQDNHAALRAYQQDVERRIAAWFAGPGRNRDWTSPANVYYGEQSWLEFLERTTWHSCQHTRQLIWVLEGLGIAPEGRLGQETFAGLPLPEQVWG